ncbi:PTS sugar transporter subunit IIB, partial [Listeria monocytogenes]|nr:PTS sugar transporter subunit IIB [Listeria monocytogenes]
MGSNGIKHVRVDERLIHGQVATMWTNTIKATRIMIVDDAVVKNEMEKVALKTAVPAGVKLSILTVKGAANNINNDK